MIDERYDHSGKVYVDVDAHFSAQGQLVPTCIIWADGRRFDIDEVMDIRKAASLKAGGAGIRYTCRILGKQVSLYLEENRWFVEAKH